MMLYFLYGIDLLDYRVQAANWIQYPETPNPKVGKMYNCPGVKYENGLTSEADCLAKCESKKDD